MNKTILTIMAIAAAASSADAKNLKAEALMNHDGWWLAPEQPTVQVNITDTLGAEGRHELKFIMTTDRDIETPIVAVAQPIYINAGKSKTLTFSPRITEPGVYACFIEDDGNRILRFNIAYEPENIVSLPDSQPDFDEFWAKAYEELENVTPDYQMTEIKEKSGKKRKIYQVKMLSLGGDTVQAMLAMPVKKGKYPVHIYYNGYNAPVWDFDADARPDWIEMLVSNRGQGLNKPYNRYEDWIQYRLDDPNEYYYRGAFMDCIRALDFIEQLPQADVSNMYAEGGSQGGAFTIVAAALDPKHRLKAIAPYIPFLSDYPDYFKVADWPGNVVLAKAREIGLDEKTLYKNLSYFDLKNMARRIKAPMLMGVGLQDPVCPVHTNFSSFNLVDSDKQFVIYPSLGHTVDYSDWTPRVQGWFSSMINN